MGARDVALRGTVDELPLPDLLHLLESTKQSGMVELTGNNPGVIVFEGGEVTLALSAMGPTLQQVFIGSGLTTGEVWDEVVGRGRRRGHADRLTRREWRRRSSCTARFCTTTRSVRCSS